MIGHLTSNALNANTQARVAYDAFSNLNAGHIEAVTNVAPLGDPISISVRGFKLALRRSEARSILLHADS